MLAEKNITMNDKEIALVSGGMDLSDEFESGNWEIQYYGGGGMCGPGQAKNVIAWFLGWDYDY